MRLAVKPVTSADPLFRLRALSERPTTPSLGPSAAVLGQATQRVVPGQFEQLLREAVAGLRDALAGLEVEKDPLTRHLGLQALARDVAASGLDPQQLSQPDEQQYARQLVLDLTGRAAQSQGNLDGAARADLEVLIRFEEGLHKRQQAAQEREAAGLDEASRRMAAERCRRDFEQHARSAAALPTTPRPLWVRLLGVALALMSCGRLISPFSRGAHRSWSPDLPLGDGLDRGALAFAVVGGRLAGTRLETMWLLSQLQRLAARKLSAGA